MPVAVVVIEAARIIGEVRLEEIEVTVEIVVADADAHAGLLGAVIAERDAPHDALLAKRPVVVVDEQQARRRVAGHVDVGPAVFIEVGGDDGHAVRLGRLRRCRPRWLTSVNVPSPLLR